jgi:YVTN family beta-propeller protein
VVLEAPSDVAISPDGRTAYVSNGRSLGDVAVIDTARVAVIGRIPVGLAPSAIAISHDGAAAYVANENSDSLSVIDTGAQAVIGTVPVGRAPAAIEIVQVGGSASSTPTPGGILLPTSSKGGSGCEIDHPASQDHTSMLAALAIGLVLLRRGRSCGVASSKDVLPSTHRVDG